MTRFYDDEHGLPGNHEPEPEYDPARGGHYLGTDPDQRHRRMAAIAVVRGPDWTYCWGHGLQWGGECPYRCGGYVQATEEDIAWARAAASREEGRALEEALAQVLTPEEFRR